MIRHISLFCTLTAVLACSDDFRGNGSDPSGAADGSSSTAVDSDGDGYSEDQGDCDDGDASVHPEAEEVPYDGINNDCKKSTRDDDLDKDGYGIETDCDDENRKVHPGKDEVAYNGLNDDCDETTPDDDLDGDGFLNEDDCDDKNDAVWPGAEEVDGNEIDDDCDELIDERFTTETVDASCDCGASSSVAVDRNGTAHVVYADAEDGTVLHKSRTEAGTWSEAEVIVNMNGWAGEHLDLTVDAFDRIHLAFTVLSADETNRELYYMFANSEGSWSEIYPVDTLANLPNNGEDEEPATTDVGWYVDLKVDTFGSPVFAYMDNNRGLPVVSSFSQDGTLTSWEQDYTITGSTGHYVNLGIDSDNGIHTVFHHRGLTLDVRYTHWDRLVFSEVVDSREGLFTSLAMKGDVPCVSFYDGYDQDLIYSCRENGTWETRQVLKEGNMGDYSQLVMTNGETPNILYYDGTSDSLRMMTKPGIGSWKQVDIDIDPGTGQYISAAAGPDGQIYTTYYDQGTGSLKFAIGQ